MSSSAPIEPELNMEESSAHEKGNRENVEFSSFFNEWMGEVEETLVTKLKSLNEGQN